MNIIKNNKKQKLQMERRSTFINIQELGEIKELKALQIKQEEEMRNFVTEQTKKKQENKKIDDIFIWDGCNYKDIDRYILGGTKVSVKTTDEILTHQNEHYKTLETISPNPIKYVIYFFSTLLPFFLNSYSIIIRWIERPERDPNEFHNWSKLSLIHIEFAGLVMLMSLFFSNYFYMIFQNQFFSLFYF